jgi:arylsulfatase A-like enzyme
LTRSRPTPVQLLAVLIACELVLVRCSSGPIAVTDGFVTVLGMLAVVLVCHLMGERGHWLVGVAWGLSLFGVVLYPLNAIADSAMFWALLVLPTITTALWLRLSWVVQRVALVPLTYGAAAVVSWMADGVVGFGPTLLFAMLLMSLFSTVTFRAPKAVWRALLVLFAVAATVTVPDFSGSDGSKNIAEKPDILLVTVDTLRADSAQEMQAFQQVASKGLSYTHALAPAPWTLPSMATIHTGVLPSEHGARGTAVAGFQAIDKDVVTLAESLQDSGYQTAAVVAANPFVGTSFGFSRGFMRDYHGREGRSLAVPRGQHIGSLGRLSLARLATDLSLAPAPGVDDADALVTRATREIERADSRPLFLWVHLLDTHLPYSHAMRAEGPWRARVGLTKLNRRGLLSTPWWREQQGVGQLKAGYENEVHEVDEALLRLLAAYQKRGLNKVTVMTADHGEEMLEHGGLEHGHTLHRELLHVPLVISGIGVAGEVENQPVSLSVIKPLLLEAAGIEPMKPTPQGLLRAPVQVSGDLLYPTKEGHLAAVLVDRWKLIQTASGPVLYDIELDIGERHDVASQYPDLVESLSNEFPGSEKQAESVGLSAEERGMLERLGYLENEFPQK